MTFRAPFLALAFGLCVLTSGCIIHIGAGTDWDWDDGHEWHEFDYADVETTEVRTVADFKSVEVNGSTNVDVRVGEATSVAVTGDANLVKQLETEVIDGRLVIGLKPGKYRSVKNLKVTVTTPALATIAVNGSADVEITGLAGGELETRISGSGDISARGEVEALSASIAGSGDLKLANLRAREASVQISGSGDASVYASESLSVAIHGSGDVRYHGDPKVTASIAGSGNVRKD